MNVTTDSLRGELERLFELDDLKALSSELLGMKPEDVGSTTAKGAFARALVERCESEDALVALADAIGLSRRSSKAPQGWNVEAQGELAVGDKVGEYVIEKKIGAGGVGTVYLARKGADKVAIKVLHSTFAKDRGAARRWQTAQRAIARLRSPHIAPVIEVGNLADGTAYVASAYQEGTQLAARLARTGPMHFNEARPVVRGVLAALETLHAAGMCHGAVKTENVFVQKPSADEKIKNDPTGVLTDAGSDRLVARPSRSVANESGLMSLAGTPKAMAPELIRSGVTTPSADLYAVGCLLYEALTGRAPFLGESGFDVAAAQLREEPQAPSVHAPKGWVVKELDAAVLKAIAKDPAARFTNAKDFVAALEALGRNTVPPQARSKADLDTDAFAKAEKGLLENPASDDAASEIERLVEPTQAWDKARAVYAKAAENAEGDAKKSLLFRVARISENDLSDTGGAEAAYKQIIEFDANDEIARVALEELKRRSGDGDGLVELLLEKVEREKTPASRARILREIADVYEAQLKDPENAYVAWLQAVSEDPRDDRALRELERLASELPGDQRQAKWSEAVTSFTEASKSTDDVGARLHLFTLMGRVYADKLARPDYAISCFKEATKLDPAYEPALDGTAELYRKGQAWQELAQVLLKKAELTANPARARDARAEVAEVYQVRLNDSGKALELYEKILLEDPTHARASEHLESIYAEKKDWKKLVELLDTKAHNQRGQEKAETLSAIAEVYEDRLSDADKAASNFQAALNAAPKHLVALKGLERVFAKKGAHPELLANLKVQLEVAATPRQRVILLERLGGLYEEEFLDKEKAAECYAEVAAVDPANQGATAALARLYRSMNRHADLAALFEKEGNDSSDETRRIERWLEAARVFLTDVGAPEKANEIIARVLAAKPSSAEALELTARIKAQAGDSKAALAATKKLAENEPDAAKKAELYLSTGRLLDRAGDKDGAIAQYKAALDADKNNREAAGLLRAVYVDRGDILGATDLLQRELDSTSGDSARAALFSELGSLRRDRLKDQKGAEEAWKRAIELDPTVTVAARGLGDFAFAKDDFANAVRYYEPLLARTGAMTPDEAKTIALQCGDSLRKIGEPARAQRAYLNAKAAAGDDRIVLERLADVTFETGSADEAAELYRQLLQKHGKDLVGQDKGRLVWSLGEALRRAGENPEAEKSLEEAAKLMPGAKDPLISLKALYTSKNEHEKVVLTLRRLIDAVSDEERLALRIEEGDVLLQKLTDKARASKAYVAALELKGDDRTVLARLLSLYSETKDWSKLVEVILRIAELEKDSARVSKYFHTAGSISYRELSRLDEAAGYYEEALSCDPSNTRAFEGLVSVLQAKADWSRLEAAYRARLKSLEKVSEEVVTPAARASTWDALGELLKHRLNKANDAVEAFENAQKIEPDNRRRAETLAEIYAASPARHFQKAVEVHQALIQKNPYRVESYQALRKLYTEAKKPDESWCICQALVALKNAEPDEDAFYKKHRSKKVLATKESLSDDLWVRNVMHPDQDALLTDIFAAITPAVIAVRAQPLSVFKVDAAQKRNPDQDEMGKNIVLAAQLAKVVMPELFAKTDDPGGLSYLFTQTPALGLGQAALAGGPSQAVGFIAGRQVAYLRNGMYLRQLVPTGGGLRAWLLAAIKVAMPQFPVPADLQGTVAENMEALRKRLPSPSVETLKSLVQKLLSAAPELDLKKWTAAVDLTADRFGFLVSNSLEMSIAIVKASPEDAAAVAQKDRLRELHLYSVSGEYLAVRAKLGVAIGDK